MKKIQQKIFTQIGLWHAQWHFFVYMFCYDIMALVGLASDAVSQITLDLNTVVCSLTFVVFALMYKIAIRGSEEEDAFR